MMIQERRGSERPKNLKPQILLRKAIAIKTMFYTSPLLVSVDKTRKYAVSLVVSPEYGIEGVLEFSHSKKE